MLPITYLAATVEERAIARAFAGHRYEAHLSRDKLAAQAADLIGATASTDEVELSRKLLGAAGRTLAILIEAGAAKEVGATQDDGNFVVEKIR